MQMTWVQVVIISFIAALAGIVFSHSMERNHTSVIELRKDEWDCVKTVQPGGACVEYRRRQ